MIKRRCSVLALIFSLFVTVLLVDIYFVHLIMEDKYVSQNTNVEVYVPITTAKSVQNLAHKVSNNMKYNTPGKSRKYYLKQGNIQLIASEKASQKLQRAVSELLTMYRNITEGYKQVLDSILMDLKPVKKISADLWKVASSWVTGKEIVSQHAPLLGSVLNTLCSSKIIKAENTRRGTQLKVLLTLEGGQQALFKPQWYPREEIIPGPVYAGRDRHNAEVAAFHLSLLLNIRRVPLTVGRKINLRREIMPVATSELIDTFYQEGNNTCFYGVCMYCEPQSPVCANKDVMEGALIMWLPQQIQFQRHPSPWQRTYKKELAARWEVEENYCSKVRNTKQYSMKNSPRLLDLVDVAIFDFLLDNGDRHHFEVPVNLEPSSVFLFDNGKSFGNPHKDHLDILAPLYQCCIIRNATWQHLKLFTGGTLSSSLEQTLKYSHISPVLTNAHLSALDRRLVSVFAAVELCIRENGISSVVF